MGKTAAGTSDALLLLGRVALAAMFIPSGLSKLAGLGGFIAGMESQGVPAAALLAPLGALIELLAGVALLVGFQTRLASALLILFTIAATLIAHRYWQFDGAERQTHQIQFSKNLAILGGLLCYAVNGGGRYCIERLWRARPAFERRRLADRRAPVIASLG
jgi:putative oxidoreductase